MKTLSGRRERTKAPTRRTIAETAIRPFLDRGCDAVGLREIATEADVAEAILFVATNPYAIGSTVTVDGGGTIA